MQIAHNRSQNWTTAADLEALEDDQWHRYGEHVRFARSAKKTDN
jgi:hypothetical protein